MQWGPSGPRSRPVRSRLLPLHTCSRSQRVIAAASRTGGLGWGDVQAAPICTVASPADRGRRSQCAARPAVTYCVTEAYATHGDGCGAASLVVGEASWRAAGAYGRGLRARRRPGAMPSCRDTATRSGKGRPATCRHCPPERVACRSVGTGLRLHRATGENCTLGDPPVRRLADEPRPEPGPRRRPVHLPCLRLHPGALRGRRLPCTDGIPSCFFVTCSSRG